jgi:SAM-dependent methyltransferase
MILFAVTIFLSAFLLFLVEPLIARLILPWFGGSAAVWTTCLMFFQVTLLIGYLYAHVVVRFLRRRAQTSLHLALLAASVLMLPILPGAQWEPPDGYHAEARILALLAATVGIPYLVLSTTGPLLQAWYCDQKRAASPYRLYALSNAGSLAALMSYPWLIERLLRLRVQAYAWSAAYLVFIAFCATLAVLLWRRANETGNPPPPAANAAVPLADRLLWMGLAFCPAALLVAVTSHITQNIAPIPLLWVIPLALYLLSFILTFESSRWYGRRFWFPLFVTAAALMFAFLFPDKGNASLHILIPLYVVGFFCCAMMCHGELYRLRPAPAALTSFYLMIAAGGALGGLFVGLFAPLVFNYYYELPIAMLITVAMIALVLARDRPSLPGPLARLIEYGLLAALACGLLYLLAYADPLWVSQYRLVERSFYGVLRVEDTPETATTAAYRELYNGTITHGAEFLDPDRRLTPTTYYGHSSGIGIALAQRSQGIPQRAGFIGLGAGTLAAYGRAGDFYRFYEINPQVMSVARNDFYFLRDSPAAIQIAPGDARLTLEHETPQHYDVIAVDAFSGDSIPVHLLTYQAFEQYFRHLKPSGLLAVHVSNKYLQLAPVVAKIAQAMHKSYLMVVNPDDDREGVSSSDWVILASDPARLKTPPWQAASRQDIPDLHVPLWTDDYSNLLSIFR